MKYTGWTLQVPCSPNREIIGKLQEQAKEMENELQQWKELVTRRREEFYELNYFNTVQLLTLRRELGQVTTDSRILSPDVLALLHSISTQVTPKAICSAVCQVTETKELENAECELKEPVADDSLNVDGVSETKSLNEVQDEVHMEVGQQQSATLKPTLTEDDLSEEQKEIMANISSRLNCSNLLVLKAFEECSGKENDRYDFIEWCTDNLDIDESLEDKSIEADSDSGESSDSDDSIAENQNFTYSASTYVSIHNYVSPANC